MIQDVIKVVQELSKTEHAGWLIIGKGPSADTLAEIQHSSYCRITLNHAIEHHTAHIAHFIDLDALLDCQEYLMSQANYVAIPWHPHINNKSTSRTLDELCEEHTILQQLKEQNRLLSYNSSTWDSRERRFSSENTILVEYFSAEAVFQILAQANIKHIYSAGIDGGSQYANQFKILEEKTLLTNGHTSFDIQFKNIARTLWTYQISHHPIAEQTPVKVFIATTKAQMLAVKVLEYSIKSRSSVAVEVIPLHLNDIEIPTPKDIINHARTPFSFQRFLIPELCKFKGKAIYLDSDMLVFQDIRNLWRTPMESHSILAVGSTSNPERSPQFSVMLMNCAKLKWSVSELIKSLDNQEITYEKLMGEMAICDSIGATIPEEWNSLEKFVRNKTSLLHYTDMPYQPWVSTWNPLGWIWCQALIKAIDDGFITINEIEEHASAGFIRPSLVWQVKNKHLDSLTLPYHTCKMDKDFIPPYQGMSIYEREYQKNFKHPKPKTPRRFLLKIRAFIREIKNEYSLSD